MKKGRLGRLLSIFMTATLVAGVLPATAYAKNNNKGEYVEGEYVATVESREHAEFVAEAYGMELDSFAHGVAVFKERSTMEKVEQTISDFVDDVASISAVEEVEEMEEADFELPELEENLIFTLFDDVEYIPLGDIEPTIAPSDNDYHHDAINTTEAWGTSKGSGVTVAIIDTGIQTSHSEFSGRSFSNAYNSATEKYGADAVEDDYGHGTHVAGIIGASTTNDDRYGVHGVAPDANLLIIKGSQKNSDGDVYFTMASLVRAIEYAVKQGADVINMSLGSTVSSTTFKTAVDDAVDKGVTIVCAAGNEGSSSVSYPAAYDSTIAVSSVDEDLAFSGWFSNYGSEIDISAPGGYVLSCVNESSYAWMAGTSMSSPIVAAVAALVLEDHSSYEPDDVKTALKDTARDAGDLGWDKYYGSGVVNAYGAVLGISGMKKVTYDYNDSKTTVITYVADGVKLLQPNDPTGDNQFLGWYLEVAGTNEFDFTTVISENTTIYAKWDVQTSGTQNAPAAPTTATDGVTSYSVTLNTIDGVEYGMSETLGEAPTEWQNSTIFMGLTANTPYYFYARMKATSTAAASANSPVLAVTTLEMESSDVSMTATYGDTVAMIVYFDSREHSSDVGFGTVTYKLGDITLGEIPNSILQDENFELIYDTSDKALSIGENSISVTFTEIDGSTTVDLATVTLNLAKKSITSVTKSVANQTYTGSALTPTVTVKDGATTLTLGTDYTVAYSNNTAVGTATITITGIGYYTGTTTKTFTISSASTSTGSSSGGGGGGGSSSGGTSVDTDGSTTTATLKIAASTSGKNTTASVESDDMEDIVDKALDDVADDGEAVVELDVNTKSYTTKMTLTVSADGLEQVSNNDVAKLNVTSDMGTLSVPAEIVSYLVDLADGDDVTFVMELVDGDDVLTDAQKLAMGDVVAYDLSIYVGDDYVGEFDGNVIRVTLPFEVVDGGNPDHIALWHIDEDGGRTAIPSTYDADAEELSFDGAHFSNYVIGYDEDSALREEVEEEEVEVVDDEEWFAVLYDEAGDNLFTDVSESDFFYNPVLWAVEHAITSGTTETTFGAYDTATRAQTVTLIWKAMGSPEPTLEENPFVDIADTDYFYKAVLWAVENSVASGTDVDTFSPNATVTRGQIVTFLWNNAGKPEAEAENPFTDVPSDMYYYNAILWAVEAGITSGTSADTFEPETLCNRGQIVTFLYRNMA